MTWIEETLLWTPRAKGRPRTGFKNGVTRSYTPRETVQAEKALREQWQHDPMEGPLGVELSMTDTMVGIRVYPVHQPTAVKLLRGDIDNYAKLILDALNGVAWIDDRQIDRLLVIKE